MALPWVAKSEEHFFIKILVKPKLVTIEKTVTFVEARISFLPKLWYQ